MLLSYRFRRTGPALREEPLPVVALALSAVVHVMVLTVLAILAGLASQWNQSKVYVVNLVPTVSPAGNGGRMTPASSPRPTLNEPLKKSPPVSAPKEKPAPVTTVKPTPKELPLPIAQAEPTPVPKELPAPAKIKPAMPKELPPPTAQAKLPRALKELASPPKSPEPPKSPLSLPSRLGALPSLGTKELTPVASAKEPQPVTMPLAPRADERTPTSEPRPVITGAPLGSADVSPSGTASLSLDVSDFPFTYYLQTIVRKVSEKWVPPAQAAGPGQRTLVLFEIRRDGKISNPTIERSSGNVLYDQAALRAVMEASPFPELPKEFTARILRVHLGFQPPTERG